MRSEHPQDDCRRPSNHTPNAPAHQQTLFAGGEQAVSPETRAAAYAESQPKLTRRLTAAMDALRAAGPRGRTRHELAADLGLSLQSVCPIALRLRREGLARESGRRPTPSGSMAAVLVAIDQGEDQ
ncbi:hypothetical protein [Roseimaritima sediminicola]|uniref:hypothetical protein n=1 Tax=Roseimaritima sediminicola TaxID=2662066 RepID=UPI001298390C|nr:hypothetical protein [Roseimaritima sediminicola]